MRNWTWAKGPFRGGDGADQEESGATARSDGGPYMASVTGDGADKLYGFGQAAAHGA